MSSGYSSAPSVSHTSSDTDLNIIDSCDDGVDETSGNNGKSLNRTEKYTDKINNVRSFECFLLPPLLDAKLYMFHT